MDGHIVLGGQYHKEVLYAFVERAVQHHQKELIVLEPSSMFLECASLYEEVKATYPCQKDWYHAQNICSITAYHAFIDAMRKESFPIRVKFGICADYFTQHEALLRQMKKAYTYDCFVGCIRFVDNIAYDWEQSKEMLWDKYNAGFLYRRSYEMMYALITSKLFDGVSGFDNIHHMQVKPGYSLQHTYQKLAMLLALHHMYVEDAACETVSVSGAGGCLSEAFREICLTKHITITPCSYAKTPEDMCF
ncbi:hypothetical protein MKC66_12760 [[Clostridium] innocuum]|nr:hypothetical protein [[Clostridium] innocuum]